MNNTYYQRLVSSVLLALSLSSSVSFNNKVANAASKSYKITERSNLNELINNINVLSSKEKDQDIDITNYRKIYNELVENFRSVLSNRIKQKDITSKSYKKFRVRLRKAIIQTSKMKNLIVNEDVNKINNMENLIVNEDVNKINNAVDVDNITDKRLSDTIDAMKANNDNQFVENIDVVMQNVESLSECEGGQDTVWDKRVVSSLQAYLKFLDGIKNEMVSKEDFNIVPNKLLEFIRSIEDGEYENKVWVLQLHCVSKYIPKSGVVSVQEVVKDIFNAKCDKNKVKSIENFIDNSTNSSFGKREGIISDLNNNDFNNEWIINYLKTKCKVNDVSRGQVYKNDNLYRLRLTEAYYLYFLNDKKDKKFAIYNKPEHELLVFCDNQSSDDDDNNNNLSFESIKNENLISTELNKKKVKDEKNLNKKKAKNTIEEEEDEV